MTGEGVRVVAGATDPTGDGVDATPRRRLRRNVLALVLCALWFLPINFAVFDGPARAAYMALLVVALVCALVQMVRGDGVVVVVLGTLLVYLAIQWLGGVSLQSSALLLAQLLAGVALQRRLPGPIAVPMFLAATTSFSLVVDAVVHDHVYMSLFAQQFFSARLDEGFRARGLIGQPVPAAHLTVCLLAYLWVVTSDLGGSRRTTARVSIAAMGAATLYTTGTRSALITAAVCVLLVIVDRRITGPRLSPVALVRTVLAGLAVIVGVVMALGDSLIESRLLSFDTLEGTASLTVRSAGLSFVTGLPNNCVSCVLIGHGQGSLQEHVRASSIVSGVSTLDNQYLSFYWDFGVVGLAALLATGLFAVRRLLRSRSLTIRAGAVGILGALAAGAFYDTTYLSTGAILVGFLLAAMTCAPARPGSGADDVDARFHPPVPAAPGPPLKLGNPDHAIGAVPTPREESLHAHLHAVPHS